MNDDETERMDVIYGYSTIRPKMHAIISIPQPRNVWEAAWWAWLGIWHDFIVPSALFALSVTPLRNPAGRVVSSTVASSRIVSLATLVSSTMA